LPGHQRESYTGSLQDYFRALPVLYHQYGLAFDKYTGPNVTTTQMVDGIIVIVEPKSIGRISAIFARIQPPLLVNGPTR